MSSRIRLGVACMAAWAGGMVVAPALERVVVHGEQLVCAGRPYRAIGVNHPPLFSSWLNDGAAGLTNSFVALEDAATSGVAFVRFWASGFWPRDMQAYFERPAEYWAAMDAVVDRAERLGVRLVPSIFWQSFLWPDLCDEPRGAISDPGSKTRAAMARYARELVGRYRGRPVILMWEIGNEYNLEADLDLGRNPRAMGAGGRHLGTRAVRDSRDSLSSEMLEHFLREMASLVRELDPECPITSGHSRPRPQSRSLRDHFPKPKWQPDSLADHLETLARQHPEPISVWSIHVYGRLHPSEDPAEPRIDGRHPLGLEMLAEYARAVRAAGRPLFVGELGPDEAERTPEQRRSFLRAAVDLLDREGADLIALWVWHFPRHSDLNLTGQSDPELLEMVREFNRTYGALPKETPP